MKPFLKSAFAVIGAIGTFLACITGGCIAFLVCCTLAILDVVILGKNETEVMKEDAV